MGYQCCLLSYAGISDFILKVIIKLYYCSSSLGVYYNILEQICLINIIRGGGGGG